jgi:lipopolysaccharide assembly outer membrane protein LptD (OstA)
MRLLIGAAILLWPVLSTAQERLHMLVSCRNCGSVVALAADSIQRDLTKVPHNPLVHAKGNVVVRMRMSPSDPGSAYMLLRADAVMYNQDTGEMLPSGNVRIKFEPTEPTIARK